MLKGSRIFLRRFEFGVLRMWFISIYGSEYLIGNCNREYIIICKNKLGMK